MTPVETSNGTSPRLSITDEPLTYREDGTHSYFGDRFRAYMDDHDAERRLERHAIESRVNPSSNTSSQALPVWLVEEAPTAQRPGRVLADRVQHRPLPAAHTVNVPAIATGTVAQQDQDNQPAPNQDFTDRAISSTVTTIVGQSVVAQQFFDQSPNSSNLDYVIWRDLTAARDMTLEQEMLYGTGVGQSLLGLLNQIPAANQVVYTSGSPTPAGLITACSQAAGKVGDNRGVAPQLFLMRTARWMWAAAADLGLSTATLPAPEGGLALAGYSGGRPNMLGLPVALDDAIPVNLGAGTADAVLCVRPDDILLFEGPTTTAVAVEADAGTLQVSLTLRQSVAMINLYPTGQASVTGTGLAAVSGW